MKIFNKILYNRYHAAVNLQWIRLVQSSERPHIVHSAGGAVWPHVPRTDEPRQRGAQQVQEECCHARQPIFPATQEAPKTLLQKVT